MFLLKLENLSKTYGHIVAIRDAELEVKRGEILGLLGASGSGKTTILRIIAGLEAPSAGKIIFEDLDVTDLATEQRGFGTVFQNQVFSEQQSVFENIAFVLKAKNVAADKIDSKVAEILSLFGLEDLEKRALHKLSDGQRQTVAVAQTIAIEPKLLLFDKPLSNLNTTRREEICAKLKVLIKKLDLTAIYVTQNQDEAFALCDRIAVLKDGQTLSVGTPRELYAEPKSVAVAHFLGRNNLIQAARVSSSASAMPEFETLDGKHRLFVDKAEREKIALNNQIVTLMIRPENVVLPFGAAFPEDNLFKAKVADVQYFGAMTRIILDANGLKIETVVLRLVGLNIGDDCMVSLPPSRISVLTD